ncbi:MAG TPA: AAA family ATPase [Gemmatimonadales bacterium]
MPRHRSLRAVLISQDPRVRETITGVTRNHGGALSLVLELDVALPAFTGAQFKAVEQTSPAVVFVDFAASPDLGISLIGDLARAADQKLVPVGIGEALSSDLLLRAMRAGLAEYLIKPLTPAAVSEAVDRLGSRLQLEEEEDRVMARTLAFFSAKGGSGSSTVVANLAIELSKLTSKRVLVVDLDAELGEISLIFGIQPQFNLIDLVQNFHRMDSELLGSYIEKHGSGVHVLSAPFHPERASGMTPEAVRQVLSYLRGLYDYVLLDTSKSFSPETLAAFEQCDEVFLVATVDLPSLRNIQRGLPMLRRVMPRGLDQVHLIINRYDPRIEISLKDVERTLDLKVYATVANDYESVMRSINAGKPLVITSAKSPAARDLHAIASRIAAVGRTEPADPGPGLLTRMFRVTKPEPAKGGKRG